MSTVLQLPAPKAELVEQPKIRLAYTRRYGWVVLFWTVARFPPGSKYPDTGYWRVRPKGPIVQTEDVLAWADLPPVPDTAA